MEEREREGKRSTYNNGQCISEWPAGWIGWLLARPYAIERKDSELLVDSLPIKTSQYALLWSLKRTAVWCCTVLMATFKLMDQATFWPPYANVAAVHASYWKVSIMVTQHRYKNVIYNIVSKWPASWSSGQSFWLHIIRSRVRFPVLPWEIFLEGEDSHGDHGLGSSV
jgi:hypothetical protein